MQENWPRPIAICVVRRDGKIFVAEGFDSTKGETFYRPLGGTIEFGEYGRDTVVRELIEEVGERLTNVRFIGTSENIFTLLGKPGHEIVLVYEGDFVNENIYDTPRVEAREGDAVFIARWMPVSDFVDGRFPLYPDGLLEMLTAD